MCRRWGRTVQVHTFSGFLITQTIYKLCMYIINTISIKNISQSELPFLQSALCSPHPKKNWLRKQNGYKTSRRHIIPWFIPQAETGQTEQQLWVSARMGSAVGKTPQTPSHPENRDVVESQQVHTKTWIGISREAPVRCKFGSSNSKKPFCQNRACGCFKQEFQSSFLPCFLLFTKNQLNPCPCS